MSEIAKTRLLRDGTKLTLQRLDREEGRPWESSSRLISVVRWASDLPLVDPDPDKWAAARDQEAASEDNARFLIYAEQFPQLLHDMEPEEAAQFMADTDYPGFIFPLYFTDDHLIDLSMDGDPYRGDQMGYVVVTPKAQKAIGTPDEHIQSVAQQELQQMQEWINGEIYALTVERPDGDYDQWSDFYRQKGQSLDDAAEEWARYNVAEADLEGSEWRDAEWVLEYRS